MRDKSEHLKNKQPKDQGWPWEEGMAEGGTVPTGVGMLLTRAAQTSAGVSWCLPSLGDLHAMQVALFSGFELLDGLALKCAENWLLLVTYIIYYIPNSSSFSIHLEEGY